MPAPQAPSAEPLPGLAFPASLAVQFIGQAVAPGSANALGTVARAIDQPLDSLPLEERARGARSIAIVIPDGTRASAAGVYLLPLISRLTRAGLDPGRIRVVLARGIHPATPRGEVVQMLGQEMVSVLRPIQSAPETPELNARILDDEDLGEVRIHRVVADADLVLLTGTVTPHHLAGWGGGPKALVPGVADRATVLAAHRLTIDALVRPDGSIRSTAGTLGDNRFHAALLRVARNWGRTFLLNVVLGTDGTIAAAAAGEVGRAQERAVELHRELYAPVTPSPSDLVVVDVAGARGRTLIQAHKGLLEALPWCCPGAPILLRASLADGPGHPSFLPWFEAGRLDRHLSALRREFHPYGLTAYSVRRIARDHPVHVVSEMSRDLLRPMGLLPHENAQAALNHILGEHAGIQSVAALRSK